MFPLRCVSLILVAVAIAAIPGIDAGTLGSHPSCETRGHGTDPLACFAEVFGTGF